MDKRIVFALAMAGCACEPIDLSGCAAPFDEPCQVYSAEGIACNSLLPVCAYSTCTCGNDDRVTCGRDLSVPLDVSAPHDLTANDSGSADDGGGSD